MKGGPQACRGYEGREEMQRARVATHVVRSPREPMTFPTREAGTLMQSTSSSMPGTNGAHADALGGSWRHARIKPTANGNAQHVTSRLQRFSAAAPRHTAVTATCNGGNGSATAPLDTQRRASRLRNSHK